MAATSFDTAVMSVKKNHISQHEEACKKRAAELRDELLFKQPESSHLGGLPHLLFTSTALDCKKSFMRACVAVKISL